MIADLIRKNRSCRRFFGEHEISAVILKDLVNLARLSASAANLQPLKYILSCSRQTNRKIYPMLAWAGYLKGWSGPDDGERPTAYITVLGDTSISKDFGADLGIAAQSILLGAREIGLSGCMIGAIRRDELRAELEIPEHLKILLVIAIGKPKESVVIESVDADGSIQYWRDDRGIHHVPKRSLADIIVRLHD